MTRFNHAPWESLRRQNVLAWLSWSCFTLPYEEAKKNRSFMTYLEKTMKTLEARTGTIIPEGYDPEISILRLTLDPVNVSVCILNSNPAKFHCISPIAFVFPLEHDMCALISGHDPKELQLVRFHVCLPPRRASIRLVLFWLSIAPCTDNQAKSRPLLLYALSNGINAWLRNVVYPHQGMSLVSFYMRLIGQKSS
jgi:hypothetical protein